MLEDRIYHIEKPNFKESDVRTLIQNVDLTKPYLCVTKDGNLIRETDENSNEIAVKIKSTSADDDAFSNYVTLLKGWSLFRVRGSKKTVTSSSIEGLQVPNDAFLKKYFQE